MESISLDAIGFGLGHIADQMTPGVKLSVAGDLQVNEWNGNKKPQLLIRDIRSDEWQLFDLRGIREPTRWLPTIPAGRYIVYRISRTDDESFPVILEWHCYSSYMDKMIITEGRKSCTSRYTG